MTQLSHQWSQLVLIQFVLLALLMSILLLLLIMIFSDKFCTEIYFELEKYLPEMVTGDVGGVLEPVKKGEVTA